MKYRTVPSSLKTWEGERAVGSDAAHDRLSPSTSCLWDEVPGQGQAQSQHSLGAETLPGAAACRRELPEPLLLTMLDYTPTAGLRKDTLLLLGGREEGRLASPAHAHPDSPTACLNFPSRQSPTSSSAPQGC